MSQNGNGNVQLNEVNDNAITHSQAEADVISWLDYKQVPAHKREENAAAIKGMIGSVRSGAMVIDAEDKTITYQLCFPIGENNSVTKLKLKARIGVGDLEEGQKGVTPGLHGMVIGTLFALTGKAKATLRKLDSTDYSALQNVATFFL